MKFSMLGMKTAAAAIGITAAGMLTVAPATADPQVVSFGQSAEIMGLGGNDVIDYTVGSLQPSGLNDGVWYSEVTARAVKGSPTPNIANFNARAVNSSTYAVMKGNKPDGLPNQPIMMGNQVSGKLYFDVKTGTAPDSVVYRDTTGTEQAVWKS